MSLDSLLVALTNIALVLATGGLIWVSIREANRHNEHEDDELVHVIDKVIDEHDKRQAATAN